MAVKTLHNALICEHENQLNLADIYFAEKIREIRIHRQKPIQWNDISNTKNHRDLQKTLEKYDHPADAQIFDAGVVGFKTYLGSGMSDSYCSFKFTAGFPEWNTACHLCLVKALKRGG